jgi:hypothetical protein
MPATSAVFRSEVIGTLFVGVFVAGACAVIAMSFPSLEW